MSERTIFDRNPFPDDPDRGAIWDILMRRDFEAFVAGDWSACAGDFDEEEFWALDARFSPHADHWRLAFPELAPYRELWLTQAREFQPVELVDVGKLEFLYRSVTLPDIEILGRRAVARKKFLGDAQKVGGGTLSLKWQTLYYLRKRERWRITGFLGYLPNRL